MRIYKYTFEICNQPEIQMPKFAKVLHFAEQDGKPTIWALVDISQPVVPHEFRLLATGEEFTKQYCSEPEYIATAMFDNGEVWHLFK